MRFGLGLGILVLAASLAPASVNIVSQDGALVVTVPGESEVYTFPLAAPGSASLDLGVAAGDDPYAEATGSTDWGLGWIALEAAAEVEAGTYSSADMTVELVFEVIAPVEYTFDFVRQVYGSSYTAFRAEVDLGDEDGWIWQTDGPQNSGYFSVCNDAHPDAVLLCTHRILPPGTYTIVFHVDARWPPYGSHGYASRSSGALDLTFTPCMDRDADGTCDAVDSRPGTRPHLRRRWSMPRPGPAR